MPMSKTLVIEIGAMIKNHLDAIKKLRNVRKLVLTSYGPGVKSKKITVLPVYAFIEEPVLEQKLEFYEAEIINQAAVSKKVHTKLIDAPEPVRTGYEQKKPV